MFGNIFLILAFFAAVISIVKYYQSSKGNESALVFARYSFHIMSALVISASLFFLYIIVTHQYQYKYVFDYSNADLTTGLLLSTFYAGQEGSFMLWLLLAVVVGIFLQNYASKKDNLEPVFMMIYSLVLVFLIAMVTPFFKSPFNFIWAETNYIDVKYINQSLLNLPILQNFIFNDSKTNQSFVQMGPDLISTLKSNGIAIGDFLIKGKGLNPLLQNFWMEVHPPILFLGFALSIVPFTFAVSALIKNNYGQWIKLALPWTVAASVVLGLGLMIGGYWAYGVLGWGGFWGWDPVENASLIPWLISVALIHTMLIQKQTQISSKDKHGRYAKTNIVLAVLMFLLVLYSTFLTRSGILSKASVHSFEDPGAAVYIFLILFILTFTVIGLGGVYYRRKSLTGLNNNKEKFLSRENGLLYGSLFLIASALVVFVGTSAPLINESVETSFYNRMNLPLTIIMGLLIGLTLFLRWRETEGSNFVRSVIPSFLISIIISAAVFVLLGIKDLTLIVFLYSIIFTIVVNIQMLIKVFRNGFYFWGGHVAHIGFALFLFGVLASSTLSKSQQIDLPLGVKTNVLNYNLTFVGAKPLEDRNKYAFDINVNNKNQSFTASPVMYISDFNNDLMREPFIYTGLTKDLYFSPLSYVDNKDKQTKAEHTSLKEDSNSAAAPSEILTVEVSTKPFISFVWIGVFIMSIGFVIVVLRRNRENKILNP